MQRLVNAVIILLVLAIYAVSAKASAADRPSYTVRDIYDPYL